MAAFSKFPPLALGKGRLEALTDGIFAIVMTLLVLDLRIPDLPRHVTDTELVSRLAELRIPFFSFTITFALSGSFWILHHLLFHHIRHVTRVLALLNIGFLFLVSLLPFSAGLFGHFPFNRISTMIYWGNQCGLSIFLFLQWKVAERSGALNPETEEGWRKRLMLRVLMLMSGSGGTAVVAWFDPRLAFNFFAVAFVIPQLVSRLLQKRAAKRAAA